MFFKYIANKEKYNINYKIILSKVDNINLYYRYDTLYNYLNYLFQFSAEKASVENKTFLKDLLKGFKLKSTYTTTKGENNIEKAYNDLVLSDKNIDDILYKKVKKELSDKNKNIFQEAKKLLDLRVEIYKTFVLDEKNLKFEKSIGETVKLKNQKDNFSETPEQKNFNNFLEQIKEEQKNIDINWFKNVFNYKTPDEMLKYLPNLKTTDSYNQATSLIEEHFTDFKMRLKLCQKVIKKNKGVKYSTLLKIF